MRSVFFLLLFANLAFLAWAEWIDVPTPVPSSGAYAKLPRLKLVGEAPADGNRPAEAPPAPEGAAPRKTALETPVQASRCLSVGPFPDESSAEHVAAQLRESGLDPRRRSVPGEVSKGFWVYIGDLKSDREVSEVLRTLQQSHVEDAQLMPDTGDVRRVSVGLFSDRQRADRRAQSLLKLGLQPEVAERKLPATLYWMDVTVPPGVAPPLARDFEAGGGPATQIGVEPCAGGSGAAPGGGPGSEPRTNPFPTKVATGEPRKVP